jgi:hypothetical protein
LEVELGEDVGDWSTGVELFGSFLEEALHQIEELVVLVRIDSGIFDDETAVFFKGLGNSFTVLSVVT